MKVILSRKGFDSSNGGCPSPIFPDETMLSLPIPSGKDGIEYSKLCYNGLNYLDLLSQLNPRRKDYSHCHLDPDLRKDICDRPENWIAAFGQANAAQGLLHNAKVEVGDIFLFFGWFRGVTKTEEGYRYIKYKDNRDFYHHANLHAIYGYMQIGEIITDSEKIKAYSWHPHAQGTCLGYTTNALYIPSEKLSINPSLPGYGTFNFRKDRVLTMEGRSRAVWQEHSFLMPDKVYGNKKNSAKKGGLYYAGVWQELVIYHSEELLDWVKGIIS